jgi:hypothetical protein
VSSTSADLATASAVGNRVVHNGKFRGTVTSKTSDTITISDTGYTEATAFTCTVSSYAKKTLTTDYTINIGTNVISTVATLTALQKLVVVPTNTLSVRFGGTAGDNVTTASSFYLKRTAGYQYNLLRVTCSDLSAGGTTLEQASVTFASGVGSGFSGLVASAKKGQAVFHKGVYIGLCTANNITTITTDNAGYTDAVAGAATVVPVGSLLFALDSGGSPGSYATSVNPADITDDTVHRIWFKDTVKVPASAMNYPNNAINVNGVEYLAP